MGSLVEVGRVQGDSSWLYVVGRRGGRDIHSPRYGRVVYGNNGWVAYLHGDRLACAHPDAPKHDPQHASTLPTRYPRATEAKTQGPTLLALGPRDGGGPHLLFSSPCASRVCDERVGATQVRRTPQLTPGQSTKVDEISYGPEPWGHRLTLLVGGSLVAGQRQGPCTPGVTATRHVFDSVGRLLGTTPCESLARSGVPNRARGGR